MTKLTNEHKQEIINLIKNKEEQFGSLRGVATFCNMSPATLSLIVQDKYVTKGDDAWLQIGNALGWKPTSSNQWVIAETTDYKNVAKIVADAKEHSLFLPISDIAGSGKTTPLKDIAEKHKTNAVFYLNCMDWDKREFLEKLCQALGIDVSRGYKTSNAMIELLIDFFQQRSLHKPLLIVDEADKLKDAAKRIFIPLYNSCEDMLGVVIAGTENLEEEIKKGVRHKKKGYDEFDSRFGRKYIKLIGCTLKDATLICNANGIDDEALIKDFFEQCNPVRKVIKMRGGTESVIRVTHDLRRLKRLVKREQLKSILN